MAKSEWPRSFKEELRFFFQQRAENFSLAITCVDAGRCAVSATLAVTCAAANAAAHEQPPICVHLQTLANNQEGFYCHCGTCWTSSATARRSAARPARPSVAVFTRSSPPLLPCDAVISNE